MALFINFTALVTTLQSFLCVSSLMVYLPSDNTNTENGDLACFQLSFLSGYQHLPHKPSNAAVEILNIMLLNSLQIHEI
jgi:hypothetical protein